MAEAEERIFGVVLMNDCKYYLQRTPHCYHIRSELLEQQTLHGV